MWIHRRQPIFNRRHPGIWRFEMTLQLCLCGCYMYAGMVLSNRGWRWEATDTVLSAAVGLAFVAALWRIARLVVWDWDGEY